MSYEEAKHPYAMRRFKNVDEEIRWARGQESAEELEACANKCESEGIAMAAEIAILVSQWRKYVAQATDRNAPEASHRAALLMMRLIDEALTLQTGVMEQTFAHAADFRRDRDQARKFEARFSFSPYSDPLLDARKANLN
jgi:hypothetical protein